MPEEKQSIVFEAKNVQAFTKGIKDASKALQEQAKASETTARELRQQIIEAKKANQPNRELIKTLSLQSQQAKLNASALRAQAAAMREQGKEAGKAAREIKSSFTGLGGVFKSLLGPLAAIGAVLSAKEIIQAADAFNQLQARVKNSLVSVSEFDSVFQKLIDSSNRSGTAIDAVAQAFVRLKPAAENLGVTNDQLIRFNETFAKMGSLAGATSEEIKNTMIQLSQGLASGTLRGDELRSVMEQMPQVARTIADSMGIPFEKFKKAAEEGKITADQVFTAIINKADETNEAFEKLPPSLERATNKLSNSVTLLIGRFNEAFKVTDVLAKGIDSLAGFINTTGKAIVEFAKEAAHLAQTLWDLIGPFTPLGAGLEALGSLFKAVSPEVNTFSGFVLQAATGLDYLSTQAQIAQNNIKRFRDELGNTFAAAGNTQKFSELDTKTQQKYDAANLGLATDFLSRTAERMSPTTTKAERDGKIRKVIPDAKKKKGKSQASIERERISAIEKNFHNRIGLERANADLDIANLGPFAKQDAVLVRQFEAEVEAAAILQRQLIALKNTAVSTAEGKRALGEAIEKTNVDIKQNEVSVKNATNALKKYYTDEQFQDFKRKQEELSAQAEFSREQAIKGDEEQAAAESEQYQRRLLAIDEYYNGLKTHLDNKAQIEKEAYDNTVKLIDAEIAKRKELYGEGANSQTVKDLQAKKNQAFLSLQGALADIDADRDKLKRDRDKDIQEAADNFGDTLENSISNAIIDAFDGDGPLKAVVNFARSLKSQIVSFLAQGLAEGFKKSAVFQQISTYFGNLFNKLSGRNGASSTGGAPNIATLTGKQAGLSAIGALLVAAGSSVAGRSQGTLGQAAGVGLGVGGGALSGALIGQALIPIPGVGALIGAAGGALLGGSAAVASTKQGQGFFGKNKNTILGSILGGIPGFFIGRASDKKRNAAIKRAEYQQNVLQPYLDSLVSGADPNNLEDLRTRAIAASRGMKANGSNGMRAKAAAQQQIKDLIAAREKSIKEAIETLTQQNQELTDSIRLADAKPFERAKIEREIALRQIESDTKKLLDQFKDSQEAQTKILEQEALKRQQLNQQEQQAAKANVQDLQDLLAERDEIANSNVFTRAKSASKIKAERLSAVDQQIAELFLELQGQLAAGITPANTAGLNQILASLNQLGGVTNKIEIIVNEANDPNAVREEITRALDAWTRKVYGTNVA